MNRTAIEGLKRVLANTYLLYLKTQNYHWNVSGVPYFKTLHELFEVQYLELAEAIDSIAERIRQLGEKSPASFAEFNQYALIKEGQSSKDALDMLTELLIDQKTMCGLLKSAIREAEEADDIVTMDLLTERMEAHEKAAWFYNSSLG